MLSPTCGIGCVSACPPEGNRKLIVSARNKAIVLVVIQVCFGWVVNEKFLKFMGVNRFKSEIKKMSRQIL